MSKPTDYYDDQNHQVMYTIDRLVALPDFVKNAEVETAQDVAELPTTSFADQFNRKFPLHTKAATYLSNAYFQQAKHLYGKEDASLIQARLEKFAHFWKISSLIENFNRNWLKVAAPDKPELSDNDFALVYKVAENHLIRRMPINNAMSVKRAGEYLYANRYKYTYPMRKMAARRILAKALFYDDKAKSGEKIAGAEEGALRFSSDTQDYLERAAGFGANAPRWVAEKVAQRALMVGDSRKELRIKLAEVAEAVADMPEVSADFLDKVATLIDSVDQETGVAGMYHQGIEMPEEMCFNVLEKEAQAVLNNYITLQNGRVFPIGTITSLPLGKIAEVMGPEFSAAVTTDNGFAIDPEKFAQIVPTLPRDDADLLTRAISAAVGAPGQEKEALEKVARRSRPDVYSDWSRDGWNDMLRKNGHKEIPDRSFQKDVKLTHPQNAQ